MDSSAPDSSNSQITVYHGEELSRYGFGFGHPFGTDRLASFWDGMKSAGLVEQVTVASPVAAPRTEIERFHTAAHVDRVMELSLSGVGFLDSGDTPAFPGVYEATAFVVGSTLDAVGRVMSGAARRAFVPIAGLHHARREGAGGFCVFNDCGVAIEVLREVYECRRIAYVDIDAHHGDGVLYGFESDPTVWIGDIHEDGRFLYPGTGWPHETGAGPAAGTKLNLPLMPQSGDEAFFAAWEGLENHIDSARPEVIILQCGADGLAEDPLTHLQFTRAAHRHAAQRLCTIADRHCAGRIVGLGGGGYNHRNLADAWTEVVGAFLA